MSMKKLLLVFLGIVIATPAFAQQVPNFSQHRRSTPPGGIYYYRNGNTNRDFQLGGSRWKTNHRKHSASHSLKHTTGR
jgi:hypothetical protein